MMVAEIRMKPLFYLNKGSCSRRVSERKLGCSTLACFSPLLIEVSNAKKRGRKDTK